MTKPTNSERVAEARAWAQRQICFELMIGSLERRIALQLDEVAAGRRR